MVLNRNKLNDANNTIADIIFAFDPSTKEVISWNNSFKNITGYNVDELKSMKYTDFFVTSDNDLNIEETISSVTNNDSTTREIIIQGKDKQKFQVEFSFSRFENYNNPYSIIAIGKIFKNRTISSHKFKFTYECFKTFLEHSPNTVEIYDIDGTLIEVNKQFEALWGIPATRTLHKYNILKSKEAGRSGLLEYVKQAYSGESVIVPPYEFDLENELNNSGQKKIKWLSTKIFPLLNESGDVSHIVINHEDVTEKKFAELTLEGNEQQLRAIFRAAPIGIGVVVKRHFVQSNERLCEMTGYSEDELLGRSSRMLYFSDEDYKYVGDEKYAQIETYGTGTVITRWKRKDGESVDILLSSTPFDANDLEMGVTFTALDITAWRTAEKLLKDSEKRTRATFNAISDAVFLHPFSEVGFKPFVDVNDTACERYKYTREEFFRLTAEDITVRVDVKEHGKKESRKSLDTAKRKVFESTHITKDGKKFPVEINSAVVELDGQKMILAVVRDISIRRNALRALIESERKFRSVIEQSNDGIYIYYNNELELVNKRFLELLNISDAELLLINSENIKNLNTNLQKLLNELTDIQKCQESATGVYNIELYDSDNNLKVLQASVTEIEYKDDLGILGILRDITQQQVLEERLIQSQKMESIGHLAGGIAHDFNNLLTPIIANSELAIMHLNPADSMYNDFQEIYETAHRAGELTRQLLAFSRKQVLDVKKVDLNQTIENFRKILRRTIRENVEIEISYSKNIGMIKVDVSQFEQILMNLAVNAQDAMPDGGKIIIKTGIEIIDEEEFDSFSKTKPGRYVSLSISDTGSGMDEETLQKIFDPFFTTKEIGKGTGLGLATVHGIVKQHDGEISVNSEHGKGTTFKILLPEYKRSKIHQRQSIESFTQLQGEESVLVVEDQAQVRKMISRILKNYGYSVEEASSAEQAEKLIKEDNINFDLLLTDLIMPGKNGKELYDGLKGDYPEMKVLFMSGYAQDVISHHGILNKGLNYISKPVSVKELAVKVKEVLHG